MKLLYPEDCDQVRQIVSNASEPIAPFWPMRTMVAQNPIHGLEYLPFDQAVRKGKDLLGGSGYLANEEYRQFYRNGRITKESFKRAFSRVGPSLEGQVSIEVGSQKITQKDVWQLHALYGFEGLPPSLLEWELSGGGATKQFRHDLSQESRKKIIEQTIKESVPLQEYPEEAYLTNLWQSVLATLELSDSHTPLPISEDFQVVGKCGYGKLVPRKINPI